MNLISGAIFSYRLILISFTINIICIDATHTEIVNVKFCLPHSDGQRIRDKEVRLYLMKEVRLYLMKLISGIQMRSFRID